MAIYSSVPPPNQQAPATGIDVNAWTISALQSLAISPSAIGTGVALSIPLDRPNEKESQKDVAPGRLGKIGVTGGANAARPKVFQRDSQRRREALLKGKEGSRRRQRWENDRLLHVPNVQPPLPSDWEVRPTYPVHSVPYYLAPLWESGVRRRAEEVAASKQKNAAAKDHKDGPDGKGRVPQELRQKLKKAKGAKSLLQDLEEEVRAFVKEWEAKERIASAAAELDSEDEEIVFVGRNGAMSDEQRATVEEELERERCVWEGLESDKGASFGRWLVHSIAAYYGLTSRSVTVGARRVAYVGIKTMKAGRSMLDVHGELPRPLYGLI